MSVIRAAAALMLALGLLVFAAPARACDERVTPGCASSASASESESQPESSFVRRVPIRETRQARSEKQARKSEKSDKAEKTQQRSRSAAASRRKALVVDDENTGEEQARAKAEPKPQSRLAEIVSAEPEFPIEIEAPSLSGARIAAMSDPVLDRDLAVEPQVAPKLSLEAKPKSSAVAEASPTGAAERRSAAVQLALKQEAERFAATQEQAARATEAAAAAAPEGGSLTMLRTAFIAFGGLLLLGTAARLVVG